MIPSNPTVLAQFGPLPSADEPLVQAVAEILAVGLGALLVVTVAAIIYRWYTREQIGLDVAILFALATAGVYLNTVGLFPQLIGTGGPELFELGTVLRNVLTLALAVLLAPPGRALGDRITTDVFAVTGARELDAELSRIVRTVGRVSAVELPEDVEDIEGYDPVPTETKESLAGKTLLFPRRLTVSELHDRLVNRLKDDYGVGHVDVDVDKDGVVSYLAVGSRAAGIGPTLAPGTVAVAVRADPPNSASAGDVVQVWSVPTVPVEAADASSASRVEPDEPTGVDPSGDESAGVDPSGDESSPGGADERAIAPDAAADSRASDGGTARSERPKRLLTAEFRAAVGDVVTLVVDGTDAGKLDSRTEYRLLTLPTESQADREFASLLRAADETMGVVDVHAESDLVGTSLGSIDATVAAIKPTTGKITPIPPRSHVLEPGDTLYVVARPETLRRLESRASEDAPPTDRNSPDGSSE